MSRSTTISPVNARRAAQRAAEHRAAILAAARQCATAHGHEATTIAEVLRACGLSRHTFYRHFSGKPALLRALADTASAPGVAQDQESVRIIRIGPRTLRGAAR